MSVKALTWSWAQQVPATEKLVLLALADHANDEDYRAWPSLTHLAKKTGLHRTTVVRALDQLERLGLINREHRSGRQTTAYRLVGAQCNQSHNATSRTQRPVAQRDQTSSTERLALVAQSDTEPSIEPSMNRHDGHDLSVNGSRFEEYWSALPPGKKVKRKEAEKLWKSKKLDAMADQIIADVKNRIENDDRWRRGYIPDPPTYLRQERWNDEIDLGHVPITRQSENALRPRFKAL